MLPLSLDSVPTISGARISLVSLSLFGDVLASLRITPLYPKLLSFHGFPF